MAVRKLYRMKHYFETFLI